MRQKLMYLTIPHADMDYLIVEPNYASDDHEYVYAVEMDENPMDDNDPETALREYYRKMRGQQ